MTEEHAVDVVATPADGPQRQLVLRALSNVPSFVKTIHNLPVGDTFRVVVSKDNAHLFKPGADGVYKPFLRNGNRFVENVELIQVPPNYIETISNVALMVNMATIAVKLEAIQVIVRNIARLIANTQRGKTKGALDALALARTLANPAERRNQTLSAGLNLVVELGALTGQLRAHIVEMPKETTGWFDGFFGTGFEEARAAYEQVEDDVGLLIEGVRELLLTYHDLNEPSAAKEAIRRICDGIKQAGLTDAIRKARLLPLGAGVAVPEVFLESFFDAITAIDKNVLRSGQPEKLFIAVYFKPEELLN